MNAIKKFGPYFIGIFILILISQSINKHYEKNETENQKLSEFLYKPKNCEYSVTFSSPPKIDEFEVFDSLGNKIRSEFALFVNEEEISMQRAESFLISNNQAEVMDKTYLSNFLKEYAENNGFSKYEITFEENNLGKIGKVRGYKTLPTSENKNENMIFEGRAYIGTKSMLLTLVSAKAKDFPTYQISKFYKSIIRSNY